MRRYTLGISGREFLIDVQEIDADRFQVTVGDQHYEVSLAGDEDLPEATISPGLQPTAGSAAASRPAAARAPAAPPVRAAAAVRSSARGGGAALNAPMPGVIIELFVKAGDRVERGQQVAVLDAMKMHNVIGAPRTGVVTEVCVAAGQAVGHGDAILRLAEG